MAYDLVDRLHHVGIRRAGQRSTARVQAHADLRGGRDRRLDVGTGRARGMEVVLVGHRGHAAEQRLAQHRGGNRLDVLRLEAARLPPPLEDGAESREPRSDQRPLEIGDGPRRPLVQVLVRVHEPG